MAKHQQTTITSGTAGAEIKPVPMALAAVTDNPVTETEAPASGTVSYELIAPLAYCYWQERGCPEGSPEKDWFRAEAQLRKEAEK